jgi:outer membrane protein
MTTTHFAALARAAVVCWSCWAPLAYAQTSSQATPAQSLQDLYEAARTFDATYLSAKALLDSAAFKAQQAEALNLPTVGLGLSGSRTTSSTPAATTTQSNSKAVNATLSGKQTLLSAANRATVAQAQKGLEVSAAEFETAEQDLIVRVAQAYFDVLAAQDALTTTRASKVAITAQLASAKRNFEVGTATITDTREAQARFDLATAQEIATVNDLQVKSLALDQLVGRANVKPQPLATPVVLPSLTPSSMEDWVKTADQEHPQVRRAQLGLQLAQLETEKAQAAHYPR